MLANLRPVELWCVIAIGQRNSRSSLCVRLGHEFYPRGWNGDWAFGDHGLHIRTAAESYRRLLKPGSDVLFIPPVHVSDVYLTEPAKWLRAMVAQHGGVQLEAA
jgi:hypothetical protein